MAKSILSSSQLICSLCIKYLVGFPAWLRHPPIDCWRFSPRKASVFEARNKTKKKKSKKKIKICVQCWGSVACRCTPTHANKHKRGEKEESLFQAILRMTKYAPRARKQQMETDEGVYTVRGVSHVPTCSSAGNSFIQRGRWALLNATSLLKRL